MATESKEDIQTNHQEINILRGENSGYYEWCIKNKELLHKMMTAKNGDKFASQEFTMCNLKWQIEVYPNGHDQSAEGRVRIMLKLLRMPQSFQKIHIFYTIDFF